LLPPRERVAVERGSIVTHPRAERKGLWQVIKQALAKGEPKLPLGLGGEHQIPQCLVTLVRRPDEGIHASLPDTLNDVETRRDVVGSVIAPTSNVGVRRWAVVEIRPLHETDQLTRIAIVFVTSASSDEEETTSHRNLPKRGE